MQIICLKNYLFIKKNVIYALHYVFKIDIKLNFLYQTKISFQENVLKFQNYERDFLVIKMQFLSVKWMIGFVIVFLCIEQTCNNN